MKRFSLFVAAALLAVPANAATIEQFLVTTQADANVRSGSPTLNFGGNNQLPVKSLSTTGGATAHKVWLRFDISGLPQGLEPHPAAVLSLTNQGGSGAFGPDGTTWSFALYGLDHNFTPEPGVLGRDWLEGTGGNGTTGGTPAGPGEITFSNAPGNLVSGANSRILPDVNAMYGMAPLATFDLIEGGTAGEVISLASDDFPDLLDYVNDSPDGLLNFILVRTTPEFSGAAGFHSFHSKDAGPLGDGFINGVFVGPTLTVSVVTPEPSSLAAWSLAALALAGLGYLRLRRSRG